MNNTNVLAFCLRLVIVFSLLCQAAKAHVQTSAPPSTEDTRISRLIGLAKVWGTVKYFHPFPAYRNINWDKALIDPIPKVNAACGRTTITESWNSTQHTSSADDPRASGWTR